MTDAPALSFRDLKVSYRQRAILTGLTLEVERGEYFGLVGINGAGKTTCIKSLLDFIAVEGGTIEIFGESHRRTGSRARLAYLPEQFVPPYYLTGREFLDQMARLHGVAASEDRCGAVVRELDLAAAALESPVREYSKGMAQKLGLAGCLLSGKDLLVLDEPMSGLDPKARILFKRRLHERRRACTVFFSTHMLFDVHDLCDRMGILHEGRLRFVGTPDECCEQFGAVDLEQAYLACISS